MQPSPQKILYSPSTRKIF
uniref:Uncharacterized protein n=1 Tax=Rhizophora mucronata TaxID=61149 RepID=A0A2P2R243_RHIMU